MKTLLFLICFLPVLWSCGKKPENPLTDAEKEVIKNEVLKVHSPSLEANKNMDMSNFILPFWDSPEFMFSGMDGSVSNLQEMKKSVSEVFNSIAKREMTITGEKWIIIDRENALCSFQGKAENSLKAGGKLFEDPFAVTLLYKKIDNQWKIVYGHESSTIKIQPGEK